jgi:holo-[acyl-carrier protein] synthase
MRILCGTDIIEVERIKTAIERQGKSFLSKVYTDKEIEYCENKGDAKYVHYAARFAVKEAVYKIVANLVDNKYSVTWRNVETVKIERDKPIVGFVGVNFNQISSIDISISHVKEYAVAMAAAIIEEKTA